MKIPLVNVRLRFSTLKLFNLFLSSTLPLIDLTQINHQPKSLGHRLSTVRGLIFFDTKMNFLKEVLNKTSVNDESQLIYLDRLDAAKHLGNSEATFLTNCRFG